LTSSKEKDEGKEGKRRRGRLGRGDFLQPRKSLEEPSDIQTAISSGTKETARRKKKVKIGTLPEVLPQGGVFVRAFIGGDVSG